MKSQFSLEYLFTYAWVFFMITLTLAAIAYLFFGSNLPETCSFPDAISCSEFSVEGDTISLVLQNSLGKDIKFRGISANVSRGTCVIFDGLNSIMLQNGTNPVPVGFTRNLDINWKANAQKQFNISCVGMSPEQYTVDIFVSYTENQLTTGVHGKIQFEGS